MYLDRDMQLAILKYFRGHYPAYVVTVQPPFPWHKNDNVRGNLVYLNELGLIEGEIKPRMGMPHTIMSAKITAKGLDFLEEDGGFDAIIRTVIVKFNPEDIKQLIEKKILSSDLPKKDKSLLNKGLETLSSEGLKEISKRLIEEGLEKSPDV